MEQFIEFVIKNWYLFLALAFILGLLIGSEVFRKLRGIKTVSPIEALQLMNHADGIMLDIRDGGEYKEGHIPDARNIPLSMLKGRLRELEKFKNKPIIVYCRSGNRAYSAATLLKKSGFELVHNLSGGLPAWQNANLPVSRK